MLIMLLHPDPDGYPYTSTMVQDPQTEYSTLMSCERAADIKRTDMLRSSVKYPDLAIVDVQITCVPTELMGMNPDNPEI